MLIRTLATATAMALIISGPALALESTGRAEIRSENGITRNTDGTFNYRTTVTRPDITHPSGAALDHGITTMRNADGSWSSVTLGDYSRGDTARSSRTTTRTAPRTDDGLTTSGSYQGFGGNSGTIKNTTSLNNSGSSRTLNRTNQNSDIRTRSGSLSVEGNTGVDVGVRARSERGGVRAGADAGGIGIGGNTGAGVGIGR